MGRMLGRLGLLVVVLVVLINIPVTRYGVSLARILPETSSLIIRDGLSPEGQRPRDLSVCRTTSCAGSAAWTRSSTWA